MTKAPRPYTQSARADASAATRRRLLDAAERAFFADEWETASLEAIADAASTTKQTLLRHFGSKPGLLTAVVERGRAQVRAQRFAVAPGDAEAAVDNLLEHYDAFGPRAMRIGTMAAGPLPELGQHARQVHYDWVGHAFAPWLDARAGAGRTRLRAALIAICDVTTWWVLHHDLGLSRADVRATLLMTIHPLLEEHQ